MQGSSWVRAAAVCLLLGGTARAEDFDTAYKVYKVWVKRPSFYKRTVARERLADTGDLRALRILMQDYARPEEPKDQVRYLLAYIAGEHFLDPPTVPIFDEWRAKDDHAEDAWLWYQALRNRVEAEGPTESMSIAKGDGNIFLRAAAIESLRFLQEGDVVPFVAEMEKKLPSSGFERGLLLESLTALLCTRVEQAKTPEFGEVAAALMRHMDEAATHDRTRIAMGRQFAKLFKTRYVWREGAHWIQELEFVQRGGKQPTDDRYEPPPTFAGIEASGDRICYVIDLSDSMLEPLTPNEMKKLPKGPITGNVQRRKEAENDRWKQAFEQVKWDKVTNKFEAARELLKTSLLGLDEKQSFCIICYGDGAGTLKGTKGLQKATLNAVQSAIKVLDAIKPGPKKDGRPYGTLFGMTNMHGGLHRAFKLKGAGMVGPGEYVNPSTFDDGCDTIFLLSDGAPTCDDWPAHDSKDPGDHAGDPELGATGPDSDNLIFQGPYRSASLVIGDVSRLDLFRKVEIHCVGMGGAQMSILEALASIGKGQAVDLTAPR